MRQKLLLLAGACCMGISSFATIHTITVGPSGGMSFSPNAIAVVNLGDTVEWVWASGIHNTTSQSIPPTADPWAEPITSSATSFRYKPTIEGTYNYNCTLHAAMMTGAFTVVSTTHVKPLTNTALSLYPNPATNMVHLKFNNATETTFVSLTDISGREVRKMQFNNITEGNLGIEDVANGTYFIKITQGASVRTERLVVAH